MTTHTPYGQDHSRKEFMFIFPSHLYKLPWYFLLLYLCCLLCKIPAWVHKRERSSHAHRHTAPRVLNTNIHKTTDARSIANKMPTKTIKKTVEIMTRREK